MYGLSKVKRLKGRNSICGGINNLQKQENQGFPMVVARH